MVIDMTKHSTSATGGGAGETISTALSKAPSPSEFSRACTQIVTRLDGHAAHRALDELVTNLLSNLGYGDGMAIFIAHVGPYHDGAAA